MGQSSAMSRRQMLALCGAGVSGAFAPAYAGGVDFSFPGGVGERSITTAFPQKAAMVLQRTRPPLLETPFEVFDQGVFTPNDRFFVRWHWAVIPTHVDTESYRLSIRGAVTAPLSLSLADLMSFPQTELVAVNQCSGNSRGFFQPRVPGGEWGNGAMGNARWTGVRLKDVLDRAGVAAGATAVRFTGADKPVVDDGPRFMKSLSVDHARDNEVMIAWAMNGASLPLLNGFPIRLVVPGWFATYWTKALVDIEVLSGPDDNFWMKTAYTIPDTPGANMRPGETGVTMVPINSMIPRSFFTNLQDGMKVKAGAPLALRGIAFGGDCGVSKVEVSSDGGATWAAARLGSDEGRYSFRQWESSLPPLTPGEVTVAVRCTNTKGFVQPAVPNWNPAGFMRNVIETTKVVAS
jgi:DMSO/TMAO reductase YedYZ molybdopterin-dependent catalytic subunit